MKKIIFGKINSSEQFIIYRSADDNRPYNFDENQYVEVICERPDCDWHAKADGKWHSGNPDIEFAWVSEEMLHIKDQLLLHEDNDRLATATESDWREYRKQLRRWNWDDNTKFPDPKFRPIRPK